MKLKNRWAWYNAWLQNWRDSYGKGTLSYARAWAELMEQELAQGRALEDIAKQASHEADTRGITGFMYGLAVQLLGEVWKHGDALLLWHNQRTAATKALAEDGASKGLAVNPAQVTLGVGCVNATPRLTRTTGMAALGMTMSGKRPRWPWQRY